MKRYHYQVTVDLLDQDEDLKNLVPGIIRDRFDGTAVKVVFVGGPIGDGDLGGTSEPAGDSPDSPPAGESRVPGGSDDYLPAQVPGGDPVIAWPVVLAGAEYEPIWEGGVELNPDGSWTQWESRPPEKSKA